ncbi:carboxypeptidase B-like [Patella vulgata]|uniref:carboxypeptidase B-like n=1 Tax=Patella vulgata TaxID=6465 RepID=UPI0024A8D192|nr:carboxypeptidase B-like [Patella vulgata]
MLNNFDWIIIPVTNPDGYEYSHTNDRYWRKNRVFRGGNCRGVDLNRNFDARWGTTGVSSSCSSDIYPGTGPMSEVEAQNVQELVADIQNGGTRLIGYLAVHSYSQMILLPYSHTFGSRPPNYQDLDNYGISAGNALYNVHGRRFQVGTGPELLYAASGGSDDWAIMGGSVKYAYTYELRPASASAGGFVLPASQIVPSGEELFASFYNLAISFNNDL